MGNQSKDCMLGNLSLAAAILVNGGKLKAAARDESGQFVFRIAGDDLDKVIEAYHSRTLQGNLPKFISALNLLRDVVTGKRDVNAVIGGIQ